MTSETKESLAWCYLTAAIAACSAGDGEKVKRHFAKFCEIAPLEYLVDLREYGFTQREILRGLIGIAERYAEHIAGGGLST